MVIKNKLLRTDKNYMSSKMRRIIIILILCVININVNAQLDLNSRGMLTITANTNDWYSALKVIVPTYNSCAYNLQYGGSDKFFVHASGYLWCERGGYFGSDSTLKENVSKINYPLSTLKKLNGYEYNYKSNDIFDSKNEHYHDKRIGLIAQEVEHILPGIVKTMPDGTKAISYTDIIPLLIESIKEQQIQIEALQSVVYNQEKELINLKHLLSLQDYARNHVEPIQEKDIMIYMNDDIYNTTKLYDNTPNPLSSETKIEFEISNNVNTAKIIINDINGKEIETHTIYERGYSSITIDCSELKDGIYFYSLLIDNIIFDTKRMVLIK